MTLIVNVVLIDVPEDSSVSFRARANSANQHANNIADSYRNSPMNKLNLGNKTAIVTITAKMDSVMPDIVKNF